MHIAIFRAVSGVNLSRDTNRFCNAVNWGYLAINRASEIDFRAKTGVRTKRVAIRIAHIAHIALIRPRLRAGVKLSASADGTVRLDFVSAASGWLYWR